MTSKDLSSLHTLEHSRKYVPQITSPLRDSLITMPNVIRNASGISLYGKRIKSVVYSLDVALLANTDADAILCVYPFTPNTQILKAVATVATVPIFAGIGGGLTQGERCARLGMLAEENHAKAVVLNGPADLETVSVVNTFVDVPIIYTVINKEADLRAYVDAGVKIFNVAGGADTAALVAWVRQQFPDIAIMASGGKTDASIMATIEAGANAITFTTYGATEQYFHNKMQHYREADHQPTD